MAAALVGDQLVFPELKREHDRTMNEGIPPIVIKMAINFSLIGYALKVFTSVF